MRVLIYLRVSSEGQFRKENPIATQKAASLEHAKNNGYEVNEETDIYIDGGISGRSTENRTAFKEMMKRIEKDEGIGGLIAYDISRISRNLMVYLQFKETLKKHNVKFFSISEPYLNDDSPVSKMLEQLLASFAEFRSGQDGEKIKEAMKRKGESGIYPGRAPFGYVNVRDKKDYGGKEKRWIETDPVASVWVKEMFMRYATGKYSLGRLARELNNEGCASPTGKPWFSSSVERILKKKTYIGYIDWGGLDNPNGLQEKLIDETTFYKVQAVMKAKNHGANKERKHKFLLRGITYCDECGSRISASYHHKKNGKIYAHYGCSKMQHTKPVVCGQSVVQTKEIEKQFEKLVKAIQIPESQANRLEEKIKTLGKKIGSSNERMKKSLALQLDNIQTRRKSLLDRLVDGTIEKDVYEGYKAGLDEKESRIKGQSEKTNEISSNNVKMVEIALVLAQNCYKTYQKATFEQKIDLVQTLFNKITIRDKKIKKAILNHPFLYICKDKASRYLVFQYSSVGGDGEN